MKIRKAVLKDAEKIHKLINYYAEKKLLLPRSLILIYENLRDFWVVESEDKIAGCVALHISWKNLAEVKSLVVEEKYRGKGFGKKLVKKAIEEGKSLGVKKIFTLTFVPEFFEKLGFKRISKSHLPHKVWNECVNCPFFPDCKEVALIYHLK